MKFEVRAQSFARYLPGWMDICTYYHGGDLNPWKYIMAQWTARGEYN